MLPKRATLALLITAGALALLLNFKTPDTSATISFAVNETASPASNGSSVTVVADATAGTAPASAATAATSTTTGSGLKDGTYTGSAAQTRYGAIQIKVTVAGGRITNVEIVRYPSNDMRSSQISQSVLPTLISETLQAQSAQINTVSGATYTSQGYISSLQSALDQAHA